MVRGLITRLERALAYFPEFTLKGTPEHVGLDYEDLWIKTADGNDIHGWWIPGPSNRRDQPTWVYFHGNGGNISARLDGYRSIHKHAGANVLAIDYRGFGLSEGEPCEALECRPCGCVSCGRPCCPRRKPTLRRSRPTAR